MLPSPKNDAPSLRVHPTWVCSLVLIAVLAVVWSPVLEHDFVAWDDNLHVYENPRFRPVTWAHLGVFWREPYENLYMPVTYIVWAALAWLTRRMSSGPLTPGLFHACNLLVHFGSVLVIYRLTMLLLGQRGAGKPWPTAAIAALAALLFGLHPLQAEAVAWVSGLKDVLSGCLGLIALWQYLECVRAQSGQRRWTHYGLGTVAFCLAVFSKPTAMVVPVLGWILATGVLEQPWKQAARWLTGWLLVAFTVGLWTKSQQPDAAIVLITPLWTRPLIALDAITFYLSKVFWPVDLGPDYGQTPQRILAQGWLLTKGILPIGLGLVLWWKRHSYWACWLAGMIFSASLLPVLGFIPFLFQGHSTVADRYVYLALLGPALGWAWVVQRMRPNATVICLSLLVLGLLGWRSAAQARVWQSTETLFTHALQVNPHSALAHNNLGLALAQQGRIAEAIVHYQEALQRRPDYAYTHNNLGLALFQQGKLAAAIAAYTQAIHLKPDYANAYNNLGLALVRQGHPVEAMAHFTRALALAPHSAQTHNNFGIALAVQGQYAAAAQQFGRAVQLQADHANAYYNLGLALSHQRQYADAITALRTALHFRPAWPAAAAQLAWLLATRSANVSETAAEAVSMAKQACVATHYHDPLAVFALAVAYQTAGQLPQAQATAQQALRLATAAAKTDIVAELQARFPDLPQKDVWHAVR